MAAETLGTVLGIVLVFLVFLVVLVILVALALFVTEPVPIDVTAIGIMVTLMVLGPWTDISPQDGVSGFSNPATITILAMMILSEGVRRTGAIQRLQKTVSSYSGESEYKQLGATIGIVGPLSGIINNTAAVAVLLPMVSDLAHERGTSPSKLLTPLSYASMAGGMLTLIGTSTNLLASDLAARLASENPSLHAFSMFEFTQLGIVVFLVTAGYLLTVGYWLAPSHVTPRSSKSSSPRARTSLARRSTPRGSRSSTGRLCWPSAEVERPPTNGSQSIESGRVTYCSSSPTLTVDRLADDPNVIVAGELARQQFRSSKLPIAVATVLSVVGLAALDVLPIIVAALGGVLVMIVVGILKPAEAYEAVQRDVIFLLAGVIPLGKALSETGGADLLGTRVASAADFLPAIAVPGLFYLLTALMTNVISNRASVVPLLPVAVDTTGRLNANANAFVLAVTFAASTAFTSPVGYQTNLFVYGPGGYEFSDYVRVGGPLQIVLAVVTTLGISVFWGA